ncbi:MAG: (4Fe-4S)-binding protein [Thermodesulfatator sp.]|nr:MAG: (4Fe-4S)-binding protein [Thermodesulfatator sp.]
MKAESPLPRVVVASGKGGTGKTLVATNLAWVAEAQIVDCDVEEPNVHLFFQVRREKRLPVKVWLPEINEEKCDYCGRCAEVCRFHALLIFPRQVFLFEEFCHSCGVCEYVCPVKAIGRRLKEIGEVRKGRAGKVTYIGGVLQVGEPRGTPVIKALKQEIDPSVPSILDAPPGTSCLAMEAVKGADLCLLVVEPTPFGLADAALAVEAFKKLGVKMAALINRSDLGEGAEEFCRHHGLEILGRIPLDRKIAEVYTEGLLVAEELPRYQELFSQVWEGIRGSL